MEAHLNALADRLEEEDLWPDNEDYYFVKLLPCEMAVVIASLRAKAKAARPTPAAEGG